VAKTYDGIGAEMADDPVSKDAPRHDLVELAVVFDLELPRLRAHRVFGRHDPDR